MNSKPHPQREFPEPYPTKKLSEKECKRLLETVHKQGRLVYYWEIADKNHKK